MHSTRKGPGGAWRTARATIRPVLEVLEERTLLDAATAGPLLDLSGLSVNSGSYSSTDILVQFRPGAAPAALPGTTLGTSTGLVAGLYTVQLDSGVSVGHAVAAYQADGAVLSASPEEMDPVHLSAENEDDDLGDPLSAAAARPGTADDLDPLWAEADLDDFELDSEQREAARGSASAEDDTDLF